MNITHLKGKIPEDLLDILTKKGITELRPAQEKALKAELLERKNLLISTPTSSGKTLIAELAAFNSIFRKIGKAIYIAPLKSLATEKYKEFKQFYGDKAKIALSIGDVDAVDPKLHEYDLIITTSEKLDSLIRHRIDWLKDVAVIIVDEIHLLNDPKRGPTLEILITILKEKLKNVQIIGLSATIGNPEELAKWLDATLVEDKWRPVVLHKGTYLQGKIELK
ncbi:DEAD/DEAH box helicase [Candidatus Woesearchaeota archaeon]|nr:DEAD/DEAH box helicase [Candidatus Woesearchaeota archaeon]